MSKLLPLKVDQHRRGRDPCTHALEHRSFFAERADEDLLENEAGAIPKGKAHEEGDRPRAARQTGGLGVEKSAATGSHVASAGSSASRARSSGLGVAPAGDRGVPRTMCCR